MPPLTPAPSAAVDNSHVNFHSSDHQRTQPLTNQQHPSRPRPTIPGYILERELGRGGMGVVYQGWHLALGRPVAIKMMLAGSHASAESLSRFDAEIHAVARLHHPNIVQIYDVGTHEGMPYFTLEFLAGGSLASRLDGKPISAQRTAELLCVIARALQTAHQVGIIHRDLKPGNILFADNSAPSHSINSPAQGGSWQASNVRISDFGVAKRLDGNDQMTATESVIGTPAYMAPEQARGQSRDVGVEADIYSLGAILYEMLTGRPPFTGQNALDILPQVMSRDPVSPSRLVPNVPRDLETICLKCLAKEHTRRYPSASALADDLDQFLKGRPISARPIGRMEKTWRWCRRYPSIAGLLTSLALVVILAFIGVTWQWRLAVAAELAKDIEAKHAIEERKAKEEEAARAETARGLAEAERRKAETHLAYSRVAQASMLWERNDVAGAEQMLDSCPTTHREWEWRYLHELCRGYLAQRQLPAWGQKVALSPDGKSVVVACGVPTSQEYPHAPVMLSRYPFPSLQDKPEGIKGLVGPLSHFAFTGQGELAVVDARQLIVVFKKDSLKVHWHQELPKGMYGCWLSQDAMYVVRALANHALQLWDKKTGKTLFTLTGHKAKITRVEIHPKSNCVISSDAQGDIRVWDLATGQQRYLLENRNVKIIFSSDGQSLAVHGETNSVRLHDLLTGQVVWSASMSDCLYGVPQFSPDGRWVACREGLNSVHVFHTRNSLNNRVLRGHDGVDITSVTFSPDSRRVVTTGNDRTVQLWNPASGEQQRIYRGHTSCVMGSVFTPDGRQLITVAGGAESQDDSLLVWDLTKDQRARHDERFPRFWPQGEYHSLLSFLSDGRLLAGYASIGLRAWDRHGVQGEEWHFNISQQRWIEWHGMAVSRDGRFAVGKGDGDKIVQTLHLPTHKITTRNLNQPIRTVAISPDGRLTAVGTRSGELHVWETQTNKVVFQQKIGSIFRIVFSGDGRQIGVGTIGVCLLDLKTKTLHRLTQKEVKGAVVGLDFHPTKPWLACTVEMPGEIHLYDTERKERVRRWKENRILGDVAFHPSGNRIAVASRQGLIALYDPETGVNVLTLQARTGRNHNQAFPPRVAWSRDGRMLAANDFVSGLWVWQAETQRATDADVLSEHRKRAKEAANQFHVMEASQAQEAKNIGATQFHLDQLAHLEAPSGRTLQDRAELFAREADWSSAVNDFRKRLAEIPQEVWLTKWSILTKHLALTELLSGNQDHYRQLCRQLYDQNKDGNDIACAALAWICVWGESGLKPTEIVGLVRRQATSQPKNPEAQVLLALGLHRTGDHKGAKIALEQARSLCADNVAMNVQIDLVLALVADRLGEEVLVRQLRQTVDGKRQAIKEMKQMQNPSIQEWLSINTLREELNRTVSRKE